MVSIYLLKVEFFFIVLKLFGVDLYKNVYFDYGVGLGYFVVVLFKLGFNNVLGLDVFKL